VKPVLLVINALDVRDEATALFAGRPVWQETLRRIASLSEGCDLLLVRHEGESLLPEACDVPQTRLSGYGAHAVLSTLQHNHSGYEWYVFLDISAVFMDPGLVTAFLGTGRHRIAQYVYGEHYPKGIAPQVLSAEALAILAGVSSGNDFRFGEEAIFDLMGLDINSWDIEMVVSETDFRRMRLDLRIRSAEALARMKALLAIDPGLVDDWSYERLARCLREHVGILRTVPAYVELDLVDACQLSCHYCPRSVREDLVPEQSVSLDDLGRLVKDLRRFAPDATIALSPYSEPLLHPQAETAIRMILDSGLRLVLETNGIALDEKLAALLASADPERSIIIFSPDFSDPERFAREKGASLLPLVEANIERLLALRQRNVWIQAIQFEADDANLDAFYERWKAHEDAILPRKYNNWCQCIPGRPAVDLSPLVRTPCWHLARDLVIRADGRVPMCKQDLECRVSPGNVFRDGLEAVWAGLERQWQEQCADPAFQGLPLCAPCDEWHTYNF